jgi:hypothetical protein
MRVRKIGLKGTPHARITHTVKRPDGRGGMREWQYHVTKGWRSYRA